MLAFREMSASDFPQMLEWLSKPHVKQWWDDGEDTLEKVALHYGEKDESAARFLLIETSENDGAPKEKLIGYFQYYFADGNVIGIDQFIGEEDYLNRGVGTEAIRLFIDKITRENNPSAIVLDPSPENKRAIRCYEKVGFEYYETVPTENGNSAYMMRLELPLSNE